MKTVNILLASFTAVLLPFCVVASELRPKDAPIVINADNRAPLHPTSKRVRDIDMYFAQIKSERDLAAHLDAHLGRGSPFDALSPNARERFISSLSFNKLGITGYQFYDLEAELSTSQAFDLLSLFGAQSTIGSLLLRQTTDRDAQINGLYRSSVEFPADDHKEYQCVGNYNCYWAMHYICMSGCGVIP